MESQKITSPSYWQRAFVAVSLTWITVSCFSVLMRNQAYGDFELMTTILLASLLASLLPGMICAWILRHRPLAMLVCSQIATSVLVALIAAK